jgi:hypothetical protein
MWIHATLSYAGMSPGNEVGEYSGNGTDRLMAPFFARSLTRVWLCDKTTSDRMGIIMGACQNHKRPRLSRDTFVTIVIDSFHNIIRG